MNDLRIFPAKRISKNEARILDYLKGKEWVSPTQIGAIVGGNGYFYGTIVTRGSSWASPICKRLVNKGLLQRNDKGWYRNPER